MKLSDSEIVARIEAEESKSYGVNDSQLSFERSEAINFI